MPRPMNENRNEAYRDVACGTCTNSNDKKKKNMVSLKVFISIDNTPREVSAYQDRRGYSPKNVIPTPKRMT